MNLKIALSLFSLLTSFDGLCNDLSYISLSGPRIRYQGELEGDSESNREDLYVGSKIRFTYGVDTGLLDETVLFREIFVEASRADGSDNPDKGYKSHLGTGILYVWRGRLRDMFTLKGGCSIYNFQGDGINEVKIVPVVGLGLSLNHKNLSDFFLVVGSGGRVGEKYLSGEGVGRAGYDIFLEGTKGIVESDWSRELDTAVYGIRVYW